MITGNDTSAQATAATTDAPTDSPAESQVDATSTTPTADGEEPDYLALLDAHGSKLDDVGGIDSVNLDAEVSKEKPDAKKTPAAPASEVEDKSTSEDDTATPDEEHDETDADGTPKKEANNFRVNLRDHKHADKLRTFLRLVKADPNSDPADLAKLAGISLAAAEAATAPDATQKPDTENASPDADPHKALRDEVAQLRKDADAAAETEFDPIKARKLDRQADAKQAELDRLDSRTNQEKASKAAAQQQDAQKQFNSDLSDSWKSVFSLYPDAQKAGSDAHTALQAAINAKHSANPKFFENADWPSLIALPTFAKRGLAPSQSAASAPVVPAKSNAAPAVTPKKTSTPVPPAPAPGATGGGTPAGWNENSGEDIFAFLERTGTKLNSTGR